MLISHESAVHKIIHKKCLLLKMLVKYIDNCVRIFIIVFGADFLQRFFNVISEYFIHGQYYLPDDRINKIMRRAYTYNYKTLILVAALVFTALARLASTGNLMHLMPSKVFLTYMPLYWIFNFAQLRYSPLGYAHWIRESHGLDYATGMASNYFHGYLKLALPEDGEYGLLQLMEKYEDSHLDVTFGLNRLIILIPDEMFVGGIIKSSLLEEATPLETRYINRAGVNRPFKHAVYRLKKKINGTTYYFAIEGATPMLSFFEGMHFQLSSTWQMMEMKREIWLKFYSHLKKLLNTWPETRDAVELIIYNSHKSNGEVVDVGEIILSHVQPRLENKKPFIY